MKVELITKDEFKPVTIQLTFETKGEFETFKLVMDECSVIKDNFKKFNNFDENIWYKVSYEIYNIIS